MKYLPVIENAYRALLSLDPVKRLDYQSELVELRDAIAEIRAVDIEEVQNEFEQVVNVTFTGMMMCKRESKSGIPMMF